jgi:hypothetical protein
MTVEELISKLQEMPKDAKVLYTDGEYQYSYKEVKLLEYKEKMTLANQANVVILSNH